VLELMAPYADYILLIGAIILDITFLPTLLGKNKPARSTALAFTLVLATFTLVFLSLGLTWSSIAQGVGAGLWGITIFQKRFTDKKVEHRQLSQTIKEERGLSEPLEDMCQCAYCRELVAQVRREL